MNNIVFQINDDQDIEDMSIYKNVVMKPMNKLIMSDKIYPIEDDKFEDIFVDDMSDDLPEDLPYPMPSIALNFNHPVKELAWISRINNATDSDDNETFDPSELLPVNCGEEWDGRGWFEDDYVVPIKNEHIIHIYKSVGQIQQNQKYVVPPLMQSLCEPDIDVKNDAICY